MLQSGSATAGCSCINEQGESVKKALTKDVAGHIIFFDFFGRGYHDNE
jgi:hypothetical protein